MLFSHINFHLWLRMIFGSLFHKSFFSVSHSCDIIFLQARMTMKREALSWMPMIWLEKEILKVCFRLKWVWRNSLHWKYAISCYFSHVIITIILVSSVSNPKQYFKVTLYTWNFLRLRAPLCLHWPNKGVLILFGYLSQVCILLPCDMLYLSNYGHLSFMDI